MLDKFERDTNPPTFKELFARPGYCDAVNEFISKASVILGMSADAGTPAVVAEVAAKTASPPKAGLLS